MLSDKQRARVCAKARQNARRHASVPYNKTLWAIRNDHFGSLILARQGLTECERPETAVGVLCNHKACLHFTRTFFHALFAWRAAQYLTPQEKADLERRGLERLTARLAGLPKNVPVCWDCHTPYFVEDPYGERSFHGCQTTPGENWTIPRRAREAQVIYNAHQAGPEVYACMQRRKEHSPVAGS